MTCLSNPQGIVGRAQLDPRACTCSFILCTELPSVSALLAVSQLPQQDERKVREIVLGAGVGYKPTRMTDHSRCSCDARPAGENTPSRPSHFSKTTSSRFCPGKGTTEKTLPSVSCPQSSARGSGNLTRHGEFRLRTRMLGFPTEPGGTGQDNKSEWLLTVLQLHWGRLLSRLLTAFSSAPKAAVLTTGCL